MVSVRVSLPAKVRSFMFASISSFVLSCSSLFTKMIFMMPGRSVLPQSSYRYDFGYTKVLLLFSLMKCGKDHSRIVPNGGNNEDAIDKCPFSKLLTVVRTQNKIGVSV